MLWFLFIECTERYGHAEHHAEQLCHRSDPSSASAFTAQPHISPYACNTPSALVMIILFTILPSPTLSHSAPTAEVGMQWTRITKRAGWELSARV